MKLIPKVRKDPPPRGRRKLRRQLTVDVDAADMVRIIAEHDGVTVSEAIRCAVKALVAARPGEFEVEDEAG